MQFTMEVVCYVVCIRNHLFVYQRNLQWKLSAMFNVYNFTIEPWPLSLKSITSFSKTTRKPYQHVGHHLD